MDVHRCITHKIQTWKQSKCLLNNEYINKMWHIHAMADYLATNKESSPDRGYNVNEP